MSSHPDSQNPGGFEAIEVKNNVLEMAVASIVSQYHQNRVFVAFILNGQRHEFQRTIPITVESAYEFIKFELALYLAKEILGQAGFNQTS